MNFAHTSVLIQESMGLLKPRPGECYLDGTLGGGGHAAEILLRSSPDGRVLGLDWDEDAVTAAGQRLSRFGERLTIRRANFDQAKDILTAINWSRVDGVLLDLGVSSHQFDAAERGFSFQASAPLDMRMDRRQKLTALEIVNSFPEAQIAKIISDYGEEPRARRIAAAIVTERKNRAIETTIDLAELIVRIRGKRSRAHHPATQTFQALRIAVNRELETLERFLEDGYDLLHPGGRMVIISFHSLEDRLVKTAFRKWSEKCICPPRILHCECGWSQKARRLTRKPIIASAEEVRANPRARAAKLRAVVRL
ncbi:MAG TPA: 16S rRNA (cytosine(1402)-N(4))-methyltransferase RsmH [Candidatus Binatia bacterium]|nr:16S rRNA (cytosine(1402)-N(4))-methyltransferase RsmH [Candidatus Binatia bacterium]